MLPCLKNFSVSQHFLYCVLQSSDGLIPAFLQYPSNININFTIKMYFYHLLFLFPTMLVSKGFPCIDILEYYNKIFGCRPCAACIKGTGIDHKQKINRTHHGMMSCYSCYECKPGTYQNENHVIKSCKPCNTCTNQRILRNCSTTENSICGNCLPGHQVKYINGSDVCEKIENSTGIAYKISTFVLCSLLLLVLSLTHCPFFSLSRFLFTFFFSLHKFNFTHGPVATEIYTFFFSLVFSFLPFFFFTQFNFKHGPAATEIYTFSFSLDLSFLSSNTGCILSVQISLHLL
ncbi:unnamed protein product [Acanthosepion pharaonis]|uniref:TNFR-Cys domain-containing protein n=1 Tax=Acanthosepion pharaonis TaxID=158019 RepID=A0A812D4B2_ACAPH|nr:unnamed protein product [Sepia pharaonis]